MRALVCLVLMGLLCGYAPMVGADEPKDDPLAFILGQDPTGSVVSLPSWASGNLTITSFNPQTLLLGVRVNVLPELLKDPPSSYSIEPGEIVTVSLKNGQRMMFYYSAKTVRAEVRETWDGGSESVTTINYEVTIFVRKLPAK